MCCSPNIPEAPTMPSYPEPADMTPMYQLQVQNQQFQNKVAAGQLGIAEGQLGLAKKQNAIAEDSFSRWKTGFMPVELEAIKDAKRGIDPAFYEAKARADSIQGATPAMNQAAKSSVQRGSKVDSPATMSDIRGLQAGMAVDMGTKQYAAKKGVEDANRARKAQIVGLGAGIPSQVVQGYGTAAGVMAGASNTMGAAGNLVNRVNQSASGLYQGMAAGQDSVNMANWQNTTSAMMSEYQMQVQQAQAAAAAKNQAISAVASIALTIAVIA